MMKASLRTDRNIFHLPRKIAAAGILVAILAPQILTGPAVAQTLPNLPALVPLLNEKVASRIPDQYIVVFKPGTSRDVVLGMQRKVDMLGGRIGHTYSSALSGFSVKLPESGLQALRAMPDIAYIEVDQVGELNTIQPPNPPVAPPTGLDRTSERLLPLDTQYTYTETGTGVHVYVIDTGIRATHTEFGGRVSGGTNTMSAAAGTGDCHGHGTHVAGTVGGSKFGIAKNVLLHPVRAGDCFNTYLAPVIAAVDWVTANRVLPAVVNLSSGFGNSAALNTAVTNSIAAPSLVTYVVAAGNSNTNACGTSPALVPAAITVGAINPANDTRASFSNIGPCVDLFAPGLNTLSAGNASDTATAVMSGTSMASPHVAGVAARYLQTHPLATPAAVWTAIHNVSNIFPATAGWAGVINPGAGSPNKLLHYGSLNDGANDGDPHIHTVNGIYYDFQNPGEFVALRDANGLEIQTRQTPVATAPWVSVNTAIAARVGAHRVTWQPNISGISDPTNLELRVDGVPVTLGTNGIALGSGARVVKSGTNGIEIDFPDGTTLVVTSNWWAAHNQWYLNVRAFHTPATEGIMGIVAPNSWLTAAFSDMWRVTDKTTLFDYARDTSTSTFPHDVFPPEKIPPLKPENVALANDVCRVVEDKMLQKGCIFDVATTGDPVFVEGALLSLQIQRGATRTSVYDDRDPTKPGEDVTFTATVARQVPSRGVPTGSVQFTLDGENTGSPVVLDKSGQAKWSTSRLVACEHRIAAHYTPDKEGIFLPSASFDETHTVISEQCRKDQKSEEIDDAM
jgi:subtilisin family serine protease